MEISDQVKAAAARSQRKDLIRKWGFVLVLVVGGAVLLVAIVNDGDFLSSALGVLGILVLFVLYFLPSFIADRRRVINKSQVRVGGGGPSRRGDVVALVGSPQ